MKQYHGPFYEALLDEIKCYGGMINAHLHLDRVFTLEDKYWLESQHQLLQSSHISLHKKHSMLNVLHEGDAFEEANLSNRVNQCLDIMVQCNTKRADTMVDVTADRVGLSALTVLNEIKKQREGQIELNLAAYSPFGFADDEPERWDIFAKGVEQADFIGALPEADEIEEYPTHIGFKEHCSRVLDLAKVHKKSLHVHTDQRNEPSETGTERLLEVIKDKGALPLLNEEPMVWAVHMISPSTYEESRFQRLVKDLKECNVGVICCPSAAIGMRQLRPIQTPTYNSIPRVLELLAAGIHVRLASDNIADICSPSTTADLVDEVFVLSAALRFYHVGILAKLAAGKMLDDKDRDIIQDHLQRNQDEIDRLIIPGSV